MAVDAVGGFGGAEKGGGGENSPRPREAAPAVAASDGSGGGGRRAGEVWGAGGCRGGGEGVGLRIVFDQAFERLVAGRNVAASKPRALLLEAHFGRGGGEGAGGGISVGVVKRLAADRHLAAAEPLALLETHPGRASARVMYDITVAHGLNGLDDGRCNIFPKPFPRPPTPKLPPGAKIPAPRLPMPPTLPRVTMLPRARNWLAKLFSGWAVSVAYKYMKWLAKRFLMLVGGWIRLGIISVIAVGIGRSVYNSRKKVEAMSISEVVVQGRILLVVADDIFEHENSRRSLVNMLQKADFEAVIPICVMERLLAQLQATRLDSFKAAAALHMIADLVILGQADLERTEWVWEGNQDGCQLYEDRVLNTARTFCHLTTNVIVFIVSNSDSIRTKSTARGLRCASPAMLLKWR